MSDLDTPDPEVTPAEAEIEETTPASVAGTGPDDQSVPEASFPDIPIDTPIAIDERKFVMVDVHSVLFELPSPSPVLRLLELEMPYRRMSFPVGLPEAQAIASARDGIESPRPLTHELFATVMRDIGIDVVAVRITSKVQGVFYAELDLMSPRGRVVVDCRPTDGIILAMRQGPPAPILVDEAVFEQP